MKTFINHDQTVQDLVAIEAKIASLTARKKEIHAQLKGYTVQGGKNFDVAGHGFTVQVRTHTRKNVDVAALKAKVSRQFLQAHTTEKEITTVSIKSYAASTTLALKGAA